MISTLSYHIGGLKRIQESRKQICLFSLYYLVVHYRCRRLQIDLIIAALLMESMSKRLARLVDF